MNFHDISLPKFIENFAVGGPEFSISCVTTLSGREIRNLDREAARQKYLINNCRISQSEFEQFSAFFRARRGMAFAFRFRDNVDYQVSQQIIAKGDGKLQQFQLTKLYQDSVQPYVRVINKPVAGTEEFYIDDIKILTEVNYNSGIITLEQPLDKGQIITGSFFFDVSVRFANDNFEYGYASDGSIELAKIELLEVI
jgi:uncharacterized protein (TIGR02217 family)